MTSSCTAVLILMFLFVNGNVVERREVMVEKGRCYAPEYKTQGWTTTVVEKSCRSERFESGVGFLFWPLEIHAVSPNEEGRGTGGILEAGPHVIRRGDSGYFSKALEFSGTSVGEVLAAAVNVDGAGPLVNLEDFSLVKRVKGPDGEWWSGTAPVGTMNTSEIHRWYARKGFTLVLNNMDGRHAGIARLAQSIEEELGISTQVNMYLTPPRSQGFEAHWDPMETIILQVEGSKRWIIYDPIIQLPRPEQRYKPTTSEINLESKRLVELFPGDTLYIPRGWLHEATTAPSAGEAPRGALHSMHLTVGIDAQDLTWELVLHTAAHASQVDAKLEDLLHWCIRGAALQEADLRRGFPEAQDKAHEKSLQAFQKGCTTENAVLAMNMKNGEALKMADMLRWWGDEAIAQGQSHGWNSVVQSMGGSQGLLEGVSRVVEEMRNNPEGIVRGARERVTAIKDARQKQRKKSLSLHGITEFEDNSMT